MRLILLLIICFPLLFTRLVEGAEWSIKGTVDQALSYDDNVLMISKDQPIDQSRGSFQYKIIPVLTFQHKTDNTEVHANALYGTQIYTDIEGLDQDIQNYSLGGLYQTQRFDWNVSANYSITPSRNNAVQNSGVFNTNSDSTTWTVSPSVSYKVDTLNSLILSPSYSETTFSDSGTSSTNQDNFNNNFSNSNTVNVDLAWQRLWSENYTSSVSLFYSTFESQQTQVINSNSMGASNFDTYGINISNSLAWSKDLTLHGTVGGRYTELTFGSETTGSFGFLADVGVNYTREYFSTGLHFGRSLTPSNLGQLQEQTNISFDVNYKILEALSASFNTNYQESTAVGSIDPSTRNNLVFQPSISWKLAPDWSLGGSYRYRFQEGLVSSTNINNTISGEADSNLFMITLNYNWHGLRTSR
jgi:hypothetical protein